MRYCPKCKKWVKGKWTPREIVLVTVLFTVCVIVPGVIYLATRTYKCPICGTETLKHEDKNKK